MTTSGSIDFSVSRDQLIESALKHISVLGDGVTPSATQLSEASVILNMIVKAKMADGMPLWAMKTGYILPQTGVTAINLGVTGDHATLSYTQTTSSAAAVAGASTISVTSSTGFASTYYIGIELADNTMQWTTINGAPSGTTITLTEALTGAMSSGAQVYVYQTKLQRPLRIVDAYRTNVLTSTRAPINIRTYQQFHALGNFTDASIPNQIYYDPQVTNGILNVYPQFSTGDYVLEIRFHRPFEDFDAAADTPDFPQEYYLPLMVTLAWLLAPKNGVPLDERKLLQQEAQMLWDNALSNGTEEGSMNLQPFPDWGYSR